MPAVPIVTARVDAATTDAVPATEQPATNAAREKLAEDAAQTTLMVVVELQLWHQEQSTALRKSVQ